MFKPIKGKMLIKVEDGEKLLFVEYPEGSFERVFHGDVMFYKDQKFEINLECAQNGIFAVYPSLMAPAFAREVAVLNIFTSEGL